VLRNDFGLTLPAVPELEQRLRALMPGA
jgi:hypothetical protein